MWPHGLYVAFQAPLSMGFSRQEYLEWVAVYSSRGSSWPRDQTQTSILGLLALAGVLYHESHLCICGTDLSSLITLQLYQNKNPLFFTQFFLYFSKMKYFNAIWHFQFSSVAQSCPTLCDLMNRSMPGLPVQWIHPKSLHNMTFQVPKHPCDAQENRQVGFQCPRNWYA